MAVRTLLIIIMFGLLAVLGRSWLHRDGLVGLRGDVGIEEPAALCASEEGSAGSREEPAERAEGVGAASGLDAAAAFVDGAKLRTASDVVAEEIVQGEREGRSLVRFEAVGPVESDGSQVLVVPLASPQDLRSFPLRFDGTATANLATGRYCAALKDSSGRQGAAVEFDHIEPGTTVVLPFVEVFSLTWVIQDGVTEGSISGASATLQRLDSVDASAQRIAVVSDSLGRVVIPEVSAGRYEVKVVGDGYVDSSAELSFPGDFRPWLSSGRLDIRAWLMFPLTDVEFQLVGYEDWGGAEGFKFAVTGETAELSFGPDGVGRAALGEYRVPLEVVLDYPNGDRVITYIDDSLIGDGSRHFLDVRGARAIQVDLRVAQSLVDVLFAHDVYLQASFGRHGVESTQLNVKIESDGVYDLRAAFADVVTVSLTQVTRGKMSMWAAAEVEFGGSETADLMLNVDAPPRAVRVTRLDEAVAGALVLARTIPNRTLWMAGGTSDDAGFVPMPRMAGPDIVADCSVGDILYALDMPLRLDGSESIVELKLDRLDSYSVAVYVDGIAGENVYLRVFGALTQDLLGGTGCWSGVDGVVRDLSFVSGSRVAVAPHAEDGLWPLSPVQEIHPGHSRVDLFKTGWLVGRRQESLLNAVWRVDGSAVKDWIDVGRTVVGASHRLPLSVMVPVGDYSTIGPEGEPLTLTVVAGEETQVP